MTCQPRSRTWNGSLLTAEDIWFFLQHLPKIHTSHQYLEDLHWFEAIFKNLACAVFEVIEVEWQSMLNFETATSKFCNCSWKFSFWPRKALWDYKISSESRELLLCTNVLSYTSYAMQKKFWPSWLSFQPITENQRSWNYRAFFQIGNSSERRTKVHSCVHQLYSLHVQSRFPTNMLCNFLVSAAVLLTIENKCVIKARAIESVQS